MQNESELLGIRIKNLRLENNLTQEKLCELANIDQSTLSRIENGGFPSLENLISILRALKEEPNSVLNFIEYEEKQQEKDIKALLMLEYFKQLDEDVKDKLIELIKVIK